MLKFSFPYTKKLHSDYRHEKNFLPLLLAVLAVRKMQGAPHELQGIEDSPALSEGISHNVIEGS